MRGILKKLALLAVPVAAYFCVFAAFEPNNYFGLKVSTSSEAPGTLMLSRLCKIRFVS